MEKQRAEIIAKGTDKFNEFKALDYDQRQIYTPFKLGEAKWKTKER